MTYIKPNNIFNSIPDYLKMVYTKRKIYEQYLPLKKEEKQLLEKLIRYKEVYTSNHIEGNSYDEFETRALLDTGVAPSGKKLKDSIEISNLNRALDFANEYNGDLDLNFIKSIHRIITAGTLDNPNNEGEFKTTRNWVGDINTCPPNAVSKQMNLLIEWYNSNISTVDPILLACRFKYRLLVIHPFSDGNGRTSRLLFNYIINKFGVVPAIILPEDRANYYKSLKESNLLGSNYRCDPLENFMCKCLVKSYEKRIELLD